MHKFVSRIYKIYTHFGINSVFNIEQALECINKEENITKSTLRSSIDLAERNKLIEIDSQSYHSGRFFPSTFYAHNWRKIGEDTSFIDRKELKHYEKIKTYYKFSEQNLFNMIKKYSLKPKDDDLNSRVVKLFLNPGENL